MLRHAATALAALVVLGGCNNASNQQATAPAGNGATPAQQANAPIGNTVTGKVSLRDPLPIGESARLEVKLVDVTMPDIVIAESNAPVTGQPPYAFTLTFDAAKIDRTRTYVVNALLFDGDRRFVPALQFPVLTGGAPSNADIVLTAEATPGEKLNDEFGKLKSQIGGMKRIQDSFLDGDLSVAWDGFYETGGKVRFMRVNTEKGEGDTAVRGNVEYAFLDDKPMVVSKKSGNGATRVGWDAQGNVVLNKAAGGGEVAEADIKTFQADAVKALAMGQAKVPKK